MQNGTPQNYSAPWPPMAEPRPRVWPGIIIILLYWAVLKLPGMLFPGTQAHMAIMFMGSMVVPGIFALWWLFFSGVCWSERFFGVLACVLVGAAARYSYHPTIQGKTFTDFVFGLIFNVLPIVFTGWVVWLLLTRS